MSAIPTVSPQIRCASGNSESLPGMAFVIQVVLIATKQRRRNMYELTTYLLLWQEAAVSEVSVLVLGANFILASQTSLSLYKINHPPPPTLTNPLRTSSAFNIVVKSRTWYRDRIAS